MIKQSKENIKSSESAGLKQVMLSLTILVLLGLITSPITGGLALSYYVITWLFGALVLKLLRIIKLWLGLKLFTNNFYLAYFLVGVGILFGLSGLVFASQENWQHLLSNLLLLSLIQHSLELFTLWRYSHLTINLRFLSFYLYGQFALMLGYNFLFCGAWWSFKLFSFSRKKDDA